MTEELPLGVRIRRARQRKFLTQAELAEQLGVDRTAVSLWETGKHFPRRYAGALEVILDITVPEPEAAAS
jgi:transcriptional regulator with XRE-family HTH domain